MRKTEDAGLAIIMVLFIVALASILVVNLTYSTYLGSRISMTAEKSVQAEYMLKAALNYAMILIREDKTPEDSHKDIWGKYSLGLPIQQDDLINFTLPETPILMEITAEGSKLNIRELAPSRFSTVNYVFRGYLEKLFTILKIGHEFDGDIYYGPNGDAAEFTMKQLIGNLIDFVDPDETAYDEDGFKGIEGPGSEFPNTEITRLGQLSAVPGFTAGRVNKLIPYLTTSDNRQININLAARPVILSLAPDMDETMADAIMTFRDSDQGPLKSTADLQDLVPGSVFSALDGKVSVASGRFQVISKVETSTSVFFLRAELQKNGRDLPTVKSLELF